MEQKAYFHIFTKGLPDTILFKDEEDNIQAVNRLALAFNDPDIKIGALCLMSNHIHVYAYGSTEVLDRCMLRFKKTYSMWYSAKYGQSKIFKGVPYSIIECIDSEYRKNVIGYIYRNPVGHSESNNPFSYKWSSLKIHFDTEGVYSGEHPVRNLKQWQKKELIGSRSDIPDDWEITQNGMISFRSFIDTMIVENMFKSIKALSYFVFNANLQSISIEEENTISDREMLIKAKKLALVTAGTENLTLLSKEQKDRISQDLTFRFGATAAIIQRIFG